MSFTPQLATNVQLVFNPTSDPFVAEVATHVRMVFSPEAPVLRNMNQFLGLLHTHD